jgi:serine/threonine protein phosphatase PrpC
MKWLGKSDIGLVRKLNQDNYFVLQDKSFTLAIVCDGMGGAKAGEVASQKACEYMSQYFNTHPIESHDIEIMKTWLKLGIQQTNTHIHRISRNNLDYEGMGTTMVAALTYGSTCVLANVGDSRIYICTDTEFRQITEDHSLVQTWIKEGRISEESAKIHPQRSVLTNVLGVLNQTHIDMFSFDHPVKGILLCSDGLHGFVSDSEIETIVRHRHTLSQKIDALIDSANQKGGLDNTTVVLLWY